MRRLLCLILALCFLAGSACAAGVCAGTSSEDVTQSDIRWFIRVNAATQFWRGETVGSGKALDVKAGSVWMLVSDSYYTAADGRSYYLVWRNSVRWHVPCDEVTVLRDAQV